ncbi:MAG: TRAP transporter substrate-binding protein DctP [Mycobacteriales bacterium]
MMTARRRRLNLGCALLVAFAAVGCGTSAVRSDKSGARRGPVALRLADTAYGPSDDLATFVRRVSEATKGQVRIEVVSVFGGHASDAEAKVVRAVGSGSMDLGWIGSQVFDTLGVTSLSALSAPMLIDSYPLERAVLDSPMAGRMLAGVAAAHVVGIGINPGYLTLPISSTKPLLTPADWTGVGFGHYRSATEEHAIRALGAIPVERFGPYRSKGLSSGELQGFALGLPVYVKLELVEPAPFVAANVVLWPNVHVLVGNPSRLTQLTRAERESLRSALRESGASAAQLATASSTSLLAACALGAHMGLATPEQLAVLRARFGDVYNTLQLDKTSAALLADIEALKAVAVPAKNPIISPSCSI